MKKAIEFWGRNSGKNYASALSVKLLLLAGQDRCRGICLSDSLDSICKLHEVMGMIVEDIEDIGEHSKMFIIRLRD